MPEWEEVRSRAEKRVISIASSRSDWRSQVQLEEEIVLASGASAIAPENSTRERSGEILLLLPERDTAFPAIPAKCLARESWMLTSCGSALQVRHCRALVEQLL